VILLPGGGFAYPACMAEKRVILLPGGGFALPGLQNYDDIP